MPLGSSMVVITLLVMVSMTETTAAIFPLLATPNGIRLFTNKFVFQVDSSTWNDLSNADERLKIIDYADVSTLQRERGECYSLLDDCNDSRYAGVPIKMNVRKPTIIRYSIPICALFFCSISLRKLYKILYFMFNVVFKHFYIGWKKRVWVIWGRL